MFPPQEPTGPPAKPSSARRGPTPALLHPHLSPPLHCFPLAPPPAPLPTLLLPPSPPSPLVPVGLPALGRRGLHLRGPLGPQPAGMLQPLPLLLPPPPRSLLAFCSSTHSPATPTPQLQPCCLLWRCPSAPLPPRPSASVSSRQPGPPGCAAGGPLAPAPRQLSPLGRHSACVRPEARQGRAGASAGPGGSLGVPRAHPGGLWLSPPGTPRPTATPMRKPRRRRTGCAPWESPAHRSPEPEAEAEAQGGRGSEAEAEVVEAAEVAVALREAAKGFEHCSQPWASRGGPPRSGCARVGVPQVRGRGRRHHGALVLGSPPQPGTAVVVWGPPKRDMEAKGFRLSRHRRADGDTLLVRPCPWAPIPPPPYPPAPGTPGWAWDGGTRSWPSPALVLRPWVCVPLLFTALLLPGSTPHWCALMCLSRGGHALPSFACPEVERHPAPTGPQRAMGRSSRA